MFGLQIQKLRMSRQLPFNFQLLPRRQVCISHDVIKAIYGLIVACCFGWVMHYLLLFPFKKLFKITGNTERAFKLDSSFFEGNKTRGIFISKVSGKDHKQKETSSRKQVTRKLLCGVSAEQWYGFQLGPAIVLICFKLSECGVKLRRSPASFWTFKPRRSQSVSQFVCLWQRKCRCCVPRCCFFVPVLHLNCFIVSIYAH